MIPSQLIPSLAMAANAAVGSVLRLGAVRLNQTRPTGEVGFVAAFVLGGVPDIAKAWRAVLHPAGFSVSMTGVFCHQTPMVTFTNASGVRRRCELADLMVVVEDLDTGPPVRRWAVLIQAKMASAGSSLSLTAAGDLTQLDLMSRWPHFTLPAGFAPGARDFHRCAYPGAAIHCGRYGLINPQPAPFWWQQQPAAVMPPAGDELGTFLARMVEDGQIGYGREATGTADDWSRTVDELIAITGAATFSYATGLRGRHRRGNSVFAVVVDADGFPSPILAASGEPPNGGPSDGDNDVPPEGGINLIRIGVGRNPDIGAR